MSLARLLLLTGWERDIAGYVAALLVFATFSMKSMLRLRIVAIGSNFAFIYYAALASVYPVLILHICLLPMNLLRLRQILLARREGHRLLSKTADAQTDFAKPLFLSPAALADPATALSLAEREQLRIACHLAARLPSTDAPIPATTGHAALLLLDAIDEFLATLAGRGGLTAPQTAHLTSLQSRNEVLRALHETLGELAATLASSAAPLPDWLASTLREGLGTILLIAEHAATNRTPDDTNMLLRMTSDRGPQVEKIRTRVMTTRTGDDTSSHRAVYITTALYERTVWLLQRYAKLLEPALTAPPPPSPPAPPPPLPAA
ncbi:MAG TPA: hypothetical protein PK231_05475 [Acidocella sp.]|nr:hypothetical protein [Acidocella sp.]